MSTRLETSVELATAARRAIDYPNVRVVAGGDAALLGTSRETAAMALFMLETIRALERRHLDHANLVHGPLHSSIGQEAVAVGVALALKPSDTLGSTHRAHHDVLAKQIRGASAGFDPLTAETVPASVARPVLRTLTEVLGLEQGLCGGRGGSMHLADEAAGVMTSAIVGGGIPPAIGTALAAKLRSTGAVSVAIFGDGATAIGAFHEALALSRALVLPTIFLLENNRYSVATSLLETAGFEELAIRAAGYDMPALVVDGMDPFAVQAAVSAARSHAVVRGPVFVEANTYRYYHQNGPLPGSAFRYRTKAEEAEWAKVDPLSTTPERLMAIGTLSRRDVEHIAGLAQSLIRECAAGFIEETPDGDRIPASFYPSATSITQGVLGPGIPPVDPGRLDPTTDGSADITYAAAISGVIGACLARDPDAFVIGEEVGHLGGGVAGLTKAALAVAPQRVLSTPICENGFVGAAFGSAMAGMHPIVELMYPDFALEAADQLFNHVAKARYMFGGDRPVPVVVRTQIARGRGYGPQHSCDPAALFSVFPGWRIAAPSTPADYVGCFNAAMLTQDPVLIIDDNRLSRTTGSLPRAGYDFVVPPGTSRLVRAGTDVTVLAWGYALHQVVPIAEQLALEGISIEIIDPRWLDLASFDRTAVIGSVARTGALVIVEDSLRRQSMGTQILDDLLPDLFDMLRAAPVRVTGADVFSSVSKPLEDAVHLADHSILEALRSLGRPRQRHRREEA